MPTGDPCRLVPGSSGDELAAAAVHQPRSNGTEIRRGPQQEVEDLDIPAFLRRHR